MTRHKDMYLPYLTPPTFLVTQEIREILMMNNGMTVEQFHKVKPDDFIHMVADEIRFQSKKHFATMMLESCSVYPPVPFDKVLPNTYREYYHGILMRKMHCRPRGPGESGL